MSYQVEILALGDTALINLRGTKTALGHFESALEMEFLRVRRRFVRERESLF